MDGLWIHADKMIMSDYNIGFMQRTMRLSLPGQNGEPPGIVSLIGCIFRDIGQRPDRAASASSASSVAMLSANASVLEEARLPA